MTQKTKKILVLAVTLIVVAFLTIAMTLFVTLKDFKTIASGEIIKDVFAVKGKNVNMYLVKLQNGDYIGFDAAVKANDVKQELAKLKIDPERVVAVFLTHTDYDHVGALKIFNKARIYISEQEEEMINGKTKRFFFSFNDRLPAPYLKLNDQDVIDFGSTKVIAVATYGHTPGSFSYIVNNNILFSGDNLLLVDNKVTTFPRLFTMDMGTQKESIRKLARFPDLKYDFTAHSGYTDNFQEAVKEWQ